VLTTNLRKVGGSVMLTIPRPILEMMHLGPGATLRLAVDGERLIVEPQKKPRYSLDELLAQCREGADAGARPEEDRVWLDMPAVGREL
jgi:antitoxin ChpS